MMDITVRDLHKSYFLDGAEIPVLKGLDFTIPSGTFLSITGPSGVGKSTLLQVMGTLDQPSAGQVQYDGRNVFDDTAAGLSAFRNRHIGFVFQFHHLLPEFTALENVMMPALIDRVGGAVAEQRARGLLAQVGLEARVKHRPGELSGGEQQRVALARALMNEPEVLLADEPTGNLDEQTGEGIFDIMRTLNKERGITVVIVTHNQRLAATMPRQMHMSRQGLSWLDQGEQPDPVPPSQPVNIPS